MVPVHFTSPPLLTIVRRPPSPPPVAPRLSRLVPGCCPRWLAPPPSSWAASSPRHTTSQVRQQQGQHQECTTLCCCYPHSMPLARYDCCNMGVPMFGFGFWDALGLLRLPDEESQKYTLCGVLCAMPSCLAMLCFVCCAERYMEVDIDVTTCRTAGFIVQVRRAERGVGV